MSTAIEMLWLRGVSQSTFHWIAVKFNHTSQRLIAQRTQQGYSPALPSVGAPGAAVIPDTYHRKHLER